MLQSGWSLEEEVEHLRQEVKNQQRRIAELSALIPEKTNAVTASQAGSLWVFGYGSLIWNPGSVPFCESRPCYVRGWRREFRQRSTDHRGTKEAPGRVVTLVASSEDSRCYGVAYCVPAHDVESVLAYLDYREKDNYEPFRVPIYGLNDSVISETALCYVGKPETLYNEEPDLAAVAKHIEAARGPSGPNSEYCLNLQRALAKQHLSCPHVFEVASRLYFL